MSRNAWSKFEVAHKWFLRKNISEKTQRMVRTGQNRCGRPLTSISLEPTSNQSALRNKSINQSSYTISCPWVSTNRKSLEFHPQHYIYTHAAKVIPKMHFIFSTAPWILAVWMPWMLSWKLANSGLKKITLPFQVYHGLSQWLPNPSQWANPSPIPIPTMNWPSIPQSTNDLIWSAEEEQHKIGWPNATRGFLSSKWERIVSLHPTSHLHTQAQDGCRQMINLIHDMFLLTTSIWQARNKVLHNHQQQGTQRIHDMEASKITALHSKSQQLPLPDWYHCTQDFFWAPQPDANKRRW